METIETLDTCIFRKLIVTVGELPSSFVESMSYYECVAWLVGYIRDNVIPTVNTQSAAIKEIQEWIETLDLQDEVDNKIDEMVESGEFATLLANYLVICGGNVKAYGATGDGETDDTAAITTAITSLKTAGINKLVFPKGTYVVSDTIEVPSDFEIVGMEGATLAFVGEGSGMNGDEVMLKIAGTTAEDYVENVKISGLKFDGTGQVYKGGYSMDTPAVTHTNPCGVGIKAIRVRFAKNVIIENCDFNDIYGDGILITYCNNVTVENNRFDSVGAGNIQLNGQTGYDNHGDCVGEFASFDVKIVGNTIINKRVYQAGISGAVGKPCGRSGIEFEFAININYENTPDDIYHNAPDYNLIPLTTVGDKQYRFGKGLVATDNYVYGYTKGVHMEDAVICIIRDNTVVHNHIGILTSTSGKTIISGNQIDTDGVGASPQTGGYDGYYGCIAITAYTSREDAKNTIINGNTIIGDGRGIVLGRDKIIVSNNIFRSKYGIFQITDNIYDVIIDSNVFSDADVDSFVAAISMKTSWFVNISNNIFTITGTPTNVVIFNHTNTRKLSMTGNIFNTVESISEVIKLVDCYDCYFSNNKLNGRCTTFVRGNTAYSITFIDNKVSDNVDNVLRMTSGFYRCSKIDKNFGKVAYSGYAPNEALLTIRDDYYERSQEVIKFNISNESTIRGWACIQAGIYTDRAWNSSPAVGRYYLNSDNTVYLCEAVGSGSATVEPTHDSGSVTESDGYKWKYCGAVAVFKNMGF